MTVPANGLPGRLGSASHAVWKNDVVKQSAVPVQYRRVFAHDPDIAGSASPDMGFRRIIYWCIVRFAWRKRNDIQHCCGVDFSCRAQLGFGAPFVERTRQVVFVGEYLDRERAVSTNWRADTCLLYTSRCV